MEKKKPKKKNQLPSGSFRIQVYSHTDVNGKKHYKSFTAPSKKEAQVLALEWQNKRQENEPENLTIYQAVEKYLIIKSNVLSPSTLRGYETIKKMYLNGSFGKKKISDINNTAIQVWVSELAEKLSPKTVRNAHGLLSATLEMFYPEFHIKTTLPAKKRPKLYTPSDEDIKKLLENIKGSELEIAVLLAAFGPLRRGEICALTSDDIKGNFIEVSKSLVYGIDRQWYTKQPKTYGGYRTIEFPDFVIERIKEKEGRLIKVTPGAITKQFEKAIKTYDLPHFRFHDLRHYAASIMHAIGVSDQYIMQRGGWSSDHVMKNVYRHAIDAEATKQNKIINDYFEKIAKTV